MITQRIRITQPLLLPSISAPYKVMTVDHKKWLMDRTKKRIKKMGYTGRVHITEDVEYQYHINSDGVHELFRDFNIHLDDLFGRDFDFVLMGEYQFIRLLDDPGAVQVFGIYDIPVDLYKKDTNGKCWKLRNVPVRVIPNFDNVVIVPKMSSRQL